jgi:hypothetical protein
MDGLSGMMLTVSLRVDPLDGLPLDDTATIAPAG